MPPTVDIVLTTNRVSRFLEETLSSVTRQTFTAWRLIVVNDGGQDPTALEALTRRLVPDARFLHRPATGVSAGRNAGLGACTGELVAFLDDDDVWHPERLELQAAALDAHRSAVASYTGGWYLDATGTVFGEGWTGEQDTRTDILRGAVPIPRIVTLLVRRDIAERVGGFDEELVVAEDLDFALRLAQQGDLVAVERELVGYRRHQGNSSLISMSEHRRSNERFLARLILCAREEGDDQMVGLLTEHLRRYRQRVGLETARRVRAMVRARQFGEAAHDLTASFRRAPGSVVNGFLVGIGSVLRKAR